MKIELLKLKRSHLQYIYLIAAIIGSIFPIIVSVSSLHNPIDDIVESPYLAILATIWGVVSFINVLVIFISGTLMYANETEHNAINKMRSLPINEMKPFINKIFIIFIGVSLTAFIQNMSLLLYVLVSHGNYKGLLFEFITYLIRFIIYSLSLITVSTFINSVTKNLWIALGFNIIAFFVSGILQQESFAFKIIPYAMYSVLLHLNEVKENLILIFSSIVITLIFISLKFFVIKRRRGLK